VRASRTTVVRSASWSSTHWICPTCCVVSLRRIALSDRDVEILADRGVHAHVGSQGWETICRAMEDAFRAGDFQGGVIRGIRAAGEHLDRHYPTDGSAKNELPDRPLIL